MLVGLENDADERKVLLACLDSLKPVRDVNLALRKILAVMEKQPRDCHSEAGGGTRKKRRVSASTNSCGEVPPREPRPWKPSDGLPTKKCWYLWNSFAEHWKKNYRVHYGKIAKMADDNEGRGNRRKGGYYEVRVHENVNLDNPGEIAWYIYNMDDEDQLVIFHTKEEAQACREMWEDEDDASGCEQISVQSVRVKCSGDELYEEIEASTSFPLRKVTRKLIKPSRSRA